MRSVFFFRRWVAWSSHDIRRSKVSCFLGAAWWSFRHAKLTFGGEARTRIPAIEFVCFFLFFLSFSHSLFLFFSFFPHLLLAFFHDQTHSHKQESCLPKIPSFHLIWRGTKSSLRTSWGRLVARPTREVRRDAERPEGDRYMAVCFTRFVGYRLMFDSGRSFSLEYDRIRSPYSGAHNPPVVLKIPRIVASSTLRSASVLYPVALRWRVTLDLSLAKKYMLYTLKAHTDLRLNTSSRIYEAYLFISVGITEYAIS